MIENKTGKELFDYRIKLIRDAQGWKKPDRIPFNANMFTWMFHDAGYTTPVATRDYKIIEECLIRFIDTYKVDQINTANSGFRNTFLVMDALGGDSNYSSKNDTNLNAITEDIFTPEDYDAVIQDGLLKTIWEKAVFRRYPNAQKFTPEQFAIAAKTQLDASNARREINTKLRDEYGTVCELNFPGFFPGYEYFFKYFRGIKGVSLDLRRHYDKLKEASEAIDAVNVPNVISALGKSEGKNWNEPYDLMIGALGHTILTVKQFETFWVPSTEKILRYCEEHDKQVCFFSEGSWERFGDFFNQFKKGTCSMMVENDDPYVIRKKFPNICIYGGLDVNVMGHGTPEECVEMAKRAINELGMDGGLVLSPNKMVSYPNDMNAENLKAVGEFVFNYQI